MGAYQVEFTVDDKQVFSRLEERRIVYADPGFNFIFEDGYLLYTPHTRFGKPGFGKP
jgi:hypothetical protein